MTMRDYTKAPLIAKTRALMAECKTIDELAAALGVARRTAIDYRSRVRRADGLTRYNSKHTQEQAKCPRCSLRGEHECLPDSATAYLGRVGAVLPALAPSIRVL